MVKKCVTCGKEFTFIAKTNQRKYCHSCSEVAAELVRKDPKYELTKAQKDSCFQINREIALKVKAEVRRRKLGY